ncbi:hypothetical protein E1A91_A09G062100v1 [Gossypium mustelinum]|uniref:Major facilitator superfamily (MFS) profile domain-containing protein n=1 Tax=Gossypium mustelinum TaxID=34275 RepID=A0A5D2XUP5_GOSMU|nr:hypothetical protein E1A91_A09G062100v1 [Gossypium mustelinum]
MPAVVVSGSGENPEFEGRITVYVTVCVIIAAFGGLMFGYDVGISGGVTSMDDFLKKFFPVVYKKKQHAHENNYCKYDNQSLQLFTSSLYIAALIASFVASKVCSKAGRKPTVQIASIFFLIGVVLTAGGLNIEMIIFGRIFLGFGVGFANQAVPLFLSEIAPTNIRGALNISFQLFITIGILLSNLVNYFTANIHPHGWRISLGIAGIPASMLCVGSILICETPTSLIERHKVEKGRKVLRKIRGVENVDDEFDSIVHACEMARQVKDPFRKLMKPVSRPPLTVGFGNDAALLSSVITGLVNVFSTIISIYLVDKAGRRILLLEACVQMLISQVIIGIILFKGLKATGANLSKGEAIFVVVLVCTFVMGFAWSWGPLGWLIPSETFPLETRSVGFAFAVSTNMLFTFVIAQAFLSMLCKMQAGIFFFFAAWIIIMGVFTWFLLPETKGVPVDSMVDKVWKQHWFWRCFVAEDEFRTDVKVV